MIKIYSLFPAWDFIRYKVIFFIKGSSWRVALVGLCLANNWYAKVYPFQYRNNTNFDSGDWQDWVQQFSILFWSIINLLVFSMCLSSHWYDIWELIDFRVFAGTVDAFIFNSNKKPGWLRKCSLNSIHIIATWHCVYLCEKTIDWYFKVITKWLFLSASFRKIGCIYLAQNLSLKGFIIVKSSSYTTDD